MYEVLVEDGTRRPTTLGVNAHRVPYDAGAVSGLRRYKRMSQDAKRVRFGLTYQPYTAHMIHLKQIFFSITVGCKRNL